MTADLILFNGQFHHAHGHEKARLSTAPVSDFAGFWGAFGCFCFAF